MVGKMAKSERDRYNRKHYHELGLKAADIPIAGDDFNSLNTEIPQDATPIANKYLTQNSTGDLFNIEPRNGGEFGQLDSILNSQDTVYEGNCRQNGQVIEIRNTQSINGMNTADSDNTNNDKTPRDTPQDYADSCVDIKLVPLSTATIKEQAQSSIEDQQENYHGKLYAPKASSPAPGSDSDKLASPNNPIFTDVYNIELKSTRWQISCYKLVCCILGLLLVASVVINALQHTIQLWAKNRHLAYASWTDANSPLTARTSYSNHTDILATMNDTRLHKVFHGISYTPENSLYPICQVNFKDTTRDVAILVQLTSRIHMTSTDCLQVQHVIAALQDLNLADGRIKLSVGVDIDRHAVNSVRQLANLELIMKQAPRGIIDEIIVGNEAIYQRNIDEEELHGYILFVKEFLKRSGIEEDGSSRTLVGVAEPGISWSSKLKEQVDLAVANVYPFFGGVPVEDSVKWAFDYAVSTVINRSSFNYPGNSTLGESKPRYVMAQIGWPTDGHNVSESLTGVNHLQTFMNMWICPNQGSDIGWYWTDIFDQHAQLDSASGDQYGVNWGYYWGLFDSNRNLKEIEIPSCK